MALYIDPKKQSILQAALALAACRYRDKPNQLGAIEKGLARLVLRRDFDVSDCTPDGLISQVNESFQQKPRILKSRHRPNGKLTHEVL